MTNHIPFLIFLRFKPYGAFTARRPKRAQHFLDIKHFNKMHYEVRNIAKICEIF